MMKSPLQPVQPDLTECFSTTVDTYQLSKELHYGYRIFRELLGQYKKHVLSIEENAAEIKGDEAKQKITFSRINTNFNENKYGTITQIISDMRLVIQNCYGSNGADHFLSKYARTLEVVIEQKLALLPRIFRDKCTIEESNIYWNKEFLNKILYGSRRRTQPMLSETSESILMSQLRQETEHIEREKRRLREEAKRLEYERRKAQLVVFEEDVLTLAILKEIKSCWELPCVGIYVYMLREFMNMADFNYTEFELAACFMHKSMLFRKIFTSLFSTPSQRQRIHLRRILTCKEWLKELFEVMSKWYNMVENEGVDYTCGLYGISKSLFTSLGDSNPLTKPSSYLSLPLKEKMCILNALCESVLEKDEAMCTSLGEIPILQRQDLYLGQDTEKNTYHFFPQFGNTDVRVYKQHFRSKSAAKTFTYEQVVSDMGSLDKLVGSFRIMKKSKLSHMYDLQQTLEALYEELNNRADSFKKAKEKGMMAIMVDYYAETEPEVEEREDSNPASDTTNNGFSAETNDILDKTNRKRDLISSRARRLLNRSQNSPVPDVVNLSLVHDQENIPQNTSPIKNHESKNETHPDGTPTDQKIKFTEEEPPMEPLALTEVSPKVDIHMRNSHKPPSLEDKHLEEKVEEMTVDEVHEIAT